MPKATKSGITHFIYPVSEGGNYTFDNLPITLENFRALAMSGEMSEWAPSTGFKLIEPGDWAWVYFARKHQCMVGVGTFMDWPVEDEWGNHQVHIRWNKQLTRALERDPITYRQYEQRVQGAVVRANPRTVRVLERWLGSNARPSLELGKKVKFSQTTVMQRLGQSAFRRQVLDTYGQTCAISGCTEPTALEAAHIVPVAAGGRHAVSNSLLLRADLHNLFDLGLLTVNPRGRVEVSSAITSEEYLDLNDEALIIPKAANTPEFKANLASHRQMYLS